jgi:hypothetical protein
MKLSIIHLAPALALGVMLAISAVAQEKTAPAFTAEQLAERSIHRRAVEAVIWGMPSTTSGCSRRLAIRGRN